MCSALHIPTARLWTSTRESSKPLRMQASARPSPSCTDRARTARFDKIHMQFAGSLSRTGTLCQGLQPGYILYTATVSGSLTASGTSSWYFSSVMKKEFGEPHSPSKNFPFEYL